MQKLKISQLFLMQDFRYLKHNGVSQLEGQPLSHGQENRYDLLLPTRSSPPLGDATIHGEFNVLVVMS